MLYSTVTSRGAFDLNILPKKKKKIIEVLTYRCEEEQLDLTPKA